jgi:hypothetical protein
LLQLRQRFGGLFCGAHITQRDIGSALGQFVRDGASDIAQSAADNGYLTVQCLHYDDCICCNYQSPTLPSR